MQHIKMKQIRGRGTVWCKTILEQVKNHEQKLLIFWKFLSVNSNSGLQSFDYSPFIFYPSLDYIVLHTAALSVTVVV